MSLLPENQSEKDPNIIPILIILTTVTYYARG